MTNMTKRDSSQCLGFLKSHILCCNQVSYSWFCLDGSSVTPKTPFLGGFYLQCILDLISQRPAPRLARFELKKIFFFDQALFRNQSIYLTYRMSQKKLLTENRRLCWETRFWTKVTWNGPDLPKQCPITWMAQSDPIISSPKVALQILLETFFGHRALAFTSILSQEDKYFDV